MNNEIDIKGIDKAELLAALYNEARPMGMGWLQASAAAMTVEQARELLSQQSYFDYVHGRPLKVDLSGDSLFGGLYDRDQGRGHAAEVVERLRRKAA